LICPVGIDTNEHASARKSLLEFARPTNSERFLSMEGAVGKESQLEERKASWNKRMARSKGKGKERARAPAKAPPPTKVPDLKPIPEPASEHDFESEEDEFVYKPFRFFDLPGELRLKIMENLFTIKNPIDIHVNPMSRLAILPVSKQWYDEAVNIFYGKNRFLLLPIHGRASAKKVKPLVMRFPPHIRAAMRNVELRLGPFWTQPPPCWKINDQLGLEDLISLKRLHVFVEVDPSLAVFNGFRAAKDFYTNFCGDLLEAILARLPFLEEIVFDGFTSVRRDMPLMSRLEAEVVKAGKRITWGSNFQRPAEPPHFRSLFYRGAADVITRQGQYAVENDLQGMVPFYSQSSQILPVKSA
jgi:hypothetical protein